MGADMRRCEIEVGCEAKTSLRLSVFALDGLVGGDALAITDWMNALVGRGVVVSVVVVEE